MSSNVRITTLILLIASLFSCSGGGDDKGNDNPAVCAVIPTKVVNGTECGNPSDSPIVRFSRDNSRLCSGAMITPNKILTAAHCIDSTLLPSDFRVVDEIAAGVSVAVHPNYAKARSDLFNAKDDGTSVENQLNKYFSSNIYPDLAVITLDRSLMRRTLPIAKSYSPQVGDGFSSYGFGERSLNANELPDTPSVALLSTFLTGKSTFIAKFIDQGLCYGDSGGPTIVQFGNGTNVITGVASAIASESEETQCSPDGLILFSSTAKNISFLQKVAPEAAYE
jgi:hypothetical protein